MKRSTAVILTIAMSTVFVDSPDINNDNDSDAKTSTAATLTIATNAT